MPSDRAMHVNSCGKSLGECPKPKPLALSRLDFHEAKRTATDRMHGHTHGQGTHAHSHGSGSTHDHAPPGVDSEAQHQATVQATFDSYRQASLSANQRRRADYYALPKSHRELLGDYSALLREVSRVTAFVSSTSFRTQMRSSQEWVR